MTNAQLQGHERVVRALEQAMRLGRLPHALLFLGPAGVGRETCARLLAAGLLCDEGEAGAPFGCARCRSCRRVAAGSHPDVHLVLAEAEGVARGLTAAEGKRQPSRDIRVAQIRELNRVMRLKPYEGRSRVAIVVDAHHMNASAANALLKTLEEPGDQALLVLTAPHERSVLPTIASRCMRLSFAPLLPAVIERLLAARGIAGAKARAELADGSMQGALALEGHEGGLERTEELLAPLLEGGTGERLDAAEALGRDRQEVDRALDALERLLATRLREGVRTDGGLAATERGRRRVVAILEAIAAARTALRENASVPLTLEHLFLSTRL
jgi:DNA polymerase III subunit delta'